MKWTIVLTLILAAFPVQAQQIMTGKDYAADQLARKDMAIMQLLDEVNSLREENKKLKTPPTPVKEEEKEKEKEKKK